MEGSAGNIRELHENGDWRGIVQLYENGFTDEKILWFQPDSDGLNFLHKNLSELGVQGVSSIGCGSGLFEWLIKSSTGLPVIGYEIDQGWWESRYSPPKFLSGISCIEPTTLPELNSKFALLFCYFNDSKAFEAYLDSFTGDCVILVGPDEKNKIRYCDPQPFQLKDSKGWRTHAVWRSKFLEAIVIYKRSTTFCPL
ncbi:uncharacterized protein LOC124198094 isoform X1 [Daphnia pulex]|uniref:uncharacterized protein LOC124198094 isoform X1 n=1 Tax=Daphnia pulex TaxID=6669 RepID=UPI001EDFDE34|nr:uncharacterized protein LOC124198094 isoform X1 [Daphnia pulex]